MQKTRTQALEKYSDIVSDAKKANCVPGAMADLGRRDLFFLLFNLLHRKDVNRDWLYDRCREVQDSPNGMLDLWAREHYKQNLLTEDILTPMGWRKFGDLNIGDEVYSQEGLPVKVLAKTPVTSDPVQYSVKLSNYQDNISETIQVGSEHRWNVVCRGKNEQKEIKNVSTKEIVDYTTAQKENKRKRWFKIPFAKALYYPERELPIDPYTLGVWLGDGSCGCGTITNGNNELINRLKGEIKTIRKVLNTKVFTVIGLKAKLRETGLLNAKSGTKYIPNKYFTASIKQRLELVRGLMDTDGGVSQQGQLRFTTTSTGLKAGMLELLSGLGFVPSVREQPKQRSNKHCWIVGFGQNEQQVFTTTHHKDKLSTRKLDYNYWYIKEVERAESKPAMCIQVEGGEYLIGRKLIPTCNSTIITFAKSIQDILDSHSENPYHWDQEVTIGIFSHTKPIAKGFLNQIKVELESNELLKQLYPDVLYENPSREAQKWSLDAGIVVKRKTNPKEATVEAHGLIDGQPTSKHFLILNYDDVVTRESVTTTDQIKKVEDGWALSLNLGAAGGVRRTIGTRYHYNDTYAEMMKRGSVQERIYPATDDGTMKGGPVLLDQSVLDDKRRDMGPYVFGCQMLQNPTVDNAMGFKSDWVEYYDNHPYMSGTKVWDKNWNYYLLCDPAGEKKRENDYTVMGVIALGYDMNYYLVEGIRDRMNLTERTEELFRLHEKYIITATGYEKYGKDSDIEHIKYVQELKNYRFPIIELGGRSPKNDRIRQLVPIFEQHRFFLPSKSLFINYEGKQIDFTEAFIEEEYKPFPVAVHDDMLDFSARICDQKLNARFPKRKARRGSRRVKVDYAA